MGGMRGLHLAFAALPAVAAASVIDFEADVGAIPDVDNSDTWWHNGKAMNATLSSLQPGDTLVIPNKTFHLMGGIRVDDVKSVTIRIDGTLAYAANMDEWPRNDETGADGRKEALECWYGMNWENVTFTSSGQGTMDGNGDVWWGTPGIGFLDVLTNRPHLFFLESGKNLLFEKILFKNSPRFSFLMQKVDGLEVRDCTVDARRTDDDGHGTVDLTAFNTDGFDVAGRNVWIHDVKVWNQDDCIAVKASSDGENYPSENMLFERVEASGLGLSIGSITEGAHVRNITFRDCTMHKTVKGIYMKFRRDGAVIEDVLYENIYMYKPSQYAIWIGPAQQSTEANPCEANPCSLCWPTIPTATCDGVDSLYKDITLRNITVDSAEGSPGVIIAGDAMPMENVVFEDVVFKNPGSSPFGSDYYECDNVQGVARGSTWPIPPCFDDETGTCVADGDCTEDGKTCCSRDFRTTLNCDSGNRCGCVAAGECATYQSDCCSGNAHKTLWCSAGVGWRCDEATADLAVPETDIIST